MRLIGALPDEQAARRFGDYLLTLGVALSIEPGSGGWDLWVTDEDHLDQARAELQRFREQPDDPKYDGAGRHANRLRREQESRQHVRRAEYVDGRTSLFQGAAHPRPLTIALMAICLLVFGVTEIANNRAPLNWLSISQYIEPPQMYRRLALPDVRHGQVWRLVTPIFLHFGILHILFNMLWLADLGSAIEYRRGTWRLAGLVLVSAAVSNLVQYWWDGPLFGGMSGVVYALLGYAWMKSRYQPQLGLGLSPNTVFIMLAWLVLCMTGLLGPIANAAHVAGLATGVAMGAASYLWRRHW